MSKVIEPEMSTKTFCQIAATRTQEPGTRVALENAIEELDNLTAEVARLQSELAEAKVLSNPEICKECLAGHDESLSAAEDRVSIEAGCCNEAINARNQAEARAEKYRAALLTRGCHDIFCKEVKYECAKCPAHHISRRQE